MVELSTLKMNRRLMLLGGAAFVAGCGREAAVTPGGSGPIVNTTVPPRAPQPQPQPQPDPTPAAVEATGEPHFPLIVDTANRLTPASAAAIAALGVKTVFRYYSHVPPSIRDKHLERPERDAIYGAGMSIGAVFQHYNNCHLTFSEGWGADDAAQALRQAEAVEQPAGSAIYFGVDGDWPYAGLLDPVLRYIEQVNQTFEGSGIGIGVYGSGCVLEQIRTRGLAQYFWLSGSTGFTGTQAFYNSNRWTLFQNQLDIRARGSVGIDTNIANPNTGGYFGQFGPSGAAPASHGPAETSLRFAERRFTARKASVRSAPAGNAAVRTTLRQHSNVVVLAEPRNGYTPVMTQEGGNSARGQSLRGWIRSSDLTTMDRFAGGVTSFGLCGANRTAPQSVVTQNCVPKARAFRLR